jgi:DNA-binding transcriptional MerR regulator
MDESLVVFTIDRVVALTGLSSRQLDYWSRTNLIRPTIDRRLSPQRPVRLYDYESLLGLMIISALRRERISIQHIRQIVAHVQGRGYEMGQLVFAIAGSKVHFQTPDGEWEDADRSQFVMSQILNLKPLRAQIQASARRDPAAVGMIERRRGAMGSKALLAGTRVPVDAVRHFLDRGIPDAEILEAYPSLVQKDIDAVRALASA